MSALQPEESVLTTSYEAEELYLFKSDKSNRENQLARQLGAGILLAGGKTQQAGHWDQYR